MEDKSKDKRQPARRKNAKRSEPTRKRRENEQMQRRTAGRRERDSLETQRRREERKERDSFAAQEAQRRREERRETAQETRRRREERGARDSLAAQEAQRRREERKKRDSRAAQEAKRRREERKERERLDDLRQKQKRKAKRRTRKRISPETWKRLLIMGGIVVAVVLSMVIFFRVQTIEVVGNNYYTPEEIMQSAGVAAGDNLLTLSRGSVAGNIMAQLPYIESVRVTRKLPNTLVLTVSEFATTYAVTDTEGDCYLITANGKVTEKIEAREAKSHIQVTELLIDPPTVGEMIQVHAAEDEALAAQGQFNALTSTLSEIEDAELVKQIVSVSIPSSYRITVSYEGRFEVDLGNTDRLDYKLEFLKKVIAEQKEYASGTIDLSLSEGEEAHVMPSN